jgi:hypothetical protein
MVSIDLHIGHTTRASSVSVLPLSKRIFSVQDLAKKKFVYPELPGNEFSEYVPKKFCMMSVGETATKNASLKNCLFSIIVQWFLTCTVTQCA